MGGGGRIRCMRDDEKVAERWPLQVCVETHRLERRREEKRGREREEVMSQAAPSQRMCVRASLQSQSRGASISIGCRRKSRSSRQRERGRSGFERREKRKKKEEEEEEE